MKTVEEMRAAHKAQLNQYLDYFMEEVGARVESPIEEMMVWGLIHHEYSDWHCGYYLGCRDIMLGGVEDKSEILTILLPSLPEDPRYNQFRPSYTLQPCVEVAGTQYRLDIAYRLASREYPSIVLYLDIECDGHDFHEKTKQQAQRDKRRDRDLQSIGWSVARFTGSEIVADPVAVGLRVHEMASGLLTMREKLFKEGLAHGNRGPAGK